MRYDVLIVGAGPTGLVLALWLAKFGVRVRIVDKTAAPGATSRALMVQARTLELYRQLDLADAVVESAHKIQAFNLWARGMRKARIRFEDVGVGTTPYPYVRMYPQDQHERLLISKLEAKGVFVDRQTELVAWADHGDRVEARLRHPKRGEEWCDAAYIAGCDGVRSIVREALRVGFPGGAHQHVFYVADLEASGPAIDGEFHVDLDEAEFLAVFPRAEQGRAQLLGKVKAELRLDSGDASFRGRERPGDPKPQPSRGENQRVFDPPRASPGGGSLPDRARIPARRRRAYRQSRRRPRHEHGDRRRDQPGVETQRRTRREGPESLLDSYESERIGFARRLVAATDRAFAVGAAISGFADFARLWLVPDTLFGLFAFHAAKEFAFRTVSQINLHYRGGPLSEGKAGGVHGGDRLPWVAMDDNHASLSQPTWQVHLYGEVRPELSAWCAARGLRLRTFPWKSPYAEAGLARNAAYLIRPDGYVALADGRGAIGELQRYFESRGLSN